MLKELEKRRLRRKERRRGSLLLTPLIDMIFLVALFFILNSGLVDPARLQVDLPRAESGVSERDTALTVVLKRDGTILVDDETVLLEDLTGVLRAVAGDRGPVPVVLAGDSGVPYGLLVRTLDKIRLSGLEDISLMTLRP